MDIQIKIILFVILILLILNYNKTENMSNTDIKKMITDIYQVDVDAIRNLSKMANDLTINNSIKVPGGLNVSGDVNVDKGLNVTGPLNFLPKGTIVAFNGTTAPTGWAICDGKTVNGYKTPDLRGRFIRMHTSGKVSKDYDKFSMKAANRSDIKGYSRNDKVSYITKQNFSEYGGSDFVKMIESEMPSHKHSMNSSGSHDHNLNSGYRVMHPNTYNRSFNSGRYTGYDRSGGSAIRLNQINTNSKGSHTHRINNTGGNNGHNNTPPYYVLTWIVKVI